MRTINFSYLLVLGFCLIGLSSCNSTCTPVIHGVVVDDVTRVLLDSVEIKFYEEGKYVETSKSDSIGDFTFHASTKTEPISLFSNSKCERDFTLIFIKRGYDSLVYNDVAPKMSMIIELKK